MPEKACKVSVCSGGTVARETCRPLLDQPQILAWGQLAGAEGVVGILLAEHYVDHLSQQLAPASGGIEAAGYLAGFKQEPPIIAIGTAVGALRICEEILDAVSGYEFRFVIYRLAKDHSVGWPAKAPAGRRLN